MKKVPLKTIVRKWPDGELIALFPEYGDRLSYTVDSYMFIGQHGAASYNHVVQSTKLASEEEYDDMIGHLEKLPGYEGFEIIPRKRASIDWSKIQS